MTGKFGVSPQKLFWQLATVLGVVILSANPLTATLQELGVKPSMDVEIPNPVSPVEAKEIYSMFTCPCCGQLLNKEKPCCGSMTQMIDFIDQKVSTGASKDEVILATAQEFGVDRLADEAMRSALREQLLARAPQDAPKISTSEVKRDLGTVRLSQGIVTTDFTIKNSGKSDLIVDKLSSSCGCTSGSLVYRGKEGPRFYMAGHGQAAPDPSWQVAIAPGDEATVHPDLTGPVTREVSIHTNDPVDFETKLTITLNQER